MNILKKFFRILGIFILLILIFLIVTHILIFGVYRDKFRPSPISFEISTAKADMDSIELSIACYYKEFNKIPDTLKEIPMKLDKDPKIRQRFLKRMEKDTWGQPYIYVKTKNGFILISCGPDKTFNTKDDIVVRADIAKLKEKYPSKFK